MTPPANCCAGVQGRFRRWVGARLQRACSARQAECQSTSTVCAFGCVASVCLHRCRSATCVPAAACCCRVQGWPGGAGCCRRSGLPAWAAAHHAWRPEAQVCNPAAALVDKTRGFGVNFQLAKRWASWPLSCWHQSWHACAAQATAFSLPAAALAEQTGPLLSPSLRSPPPARSNVLLSPQLRACLGDLGVAQALGSRARTAAGFTATYAGASALGGLPACPPQQGDHRPLLCATPAMRFPWKHERGRSTLSAASPSVAAPEQLLGQRCSVAADIYRCARDLLGPCCTNRSHRPHPGGCGWQVISSSC